MEALDRAIAAAEKRLQESGLSTVLCKALTQARQVRKKRFESIGGRWFRYTCSLHPGDLDNIRRELGDAAMALSKATNR